MAPGTSDDLPSAEVLGKLFRASVDALSHDGPGWLTPAKKYHALVILGLARRESVITQESLSRAYSDVAKAVQEGTAGVDRLAAWLQLDERDELSRALLERLLVPKHVLGIKMKDGAVYTEGAFTGQFSKHVNKVLTVASILVAKGADRAGGRFALYKLRKLGTQPLAYGIRRERTVSAEDRDMRNVVAHAQAIAEARERGAAARASVPHIAAGAGTVAADKPYCKHTEGFIAEHREHVRVVEDTSPLNLHYLLFRVKKFDTAKHEIVTRINRRRRLPSYEAGRLTDIGVWSTLGEADLVFRFRTESDAAAGALVDEIQVLLEAEDALEATTGPNPQMIVADQELINGLYAAPQPRPTFFEAKKQHILYLDMDKHRYATFFIFIHYTHPKWRAKDRIEYVRAILESDRDLLHVVEAINHAHAYGEDQEDWLVIEGQLPCGMFSLLMKLSLKLEYEVAKGQGAKETLIAYEMVCQYHDDLRAKIPILG
jgi:hypothetical protein